MKINNIEYELENIEIATRQIEFNPGIFETEKWAGEAVIERSDLPPPVKGMPITDLKMPPKMIIKDVIELGFGQYKIYFGEE
jgi:hypothetical protein